MTDARQFDPITFQVLWSRAVAIADEMAATLVKTAFSTSVRDSHDYAVAFYDARGDLLAQARQCTPGQLGAMPRVLHNFLDVYPADSLDPGDVLVTNDPQNGGSHLPDITVITPVFGTDGGAPRFFVASRGHHAEIGGISPGSVPPFSRTLAEEGACITSFKLVKDGRFQEEGSTELMMAPGRIPPIPGRPVNSGTRRLQDNLYDLKAQVAANRKGAELLTEMIDHFTLEVVQAYMGHIQLNAEEVVRQLTVRLCDERDIETTGTCHAIDYMDDGNPIEVTITLDRPNRALAFDFTGTGPEVWANHNVPRAVVYSAIIYVLRTLIDVDIPINGGFLKAVDITIPHPSMLSPSPEAAVVAGNVETSQIITDTLYGALGVMAGAQGTMNNLTFGNERYQYYETICGGSGAGPDFDGTDAIHTHMTNSRLTDPEVLEWRFPVLVESFEIRRGSGGAGRQRGGDGARRRLRFREPMTAAILSSHREVAPFGVAGGQPGTCGRNWVERADGTEYALSGTDKTEMGAGDAIVIETPGGGGWGRPPQ